MKSDAKKSVHKEEMEPKASQTAAPVFIFVVLALLLYWGALHIDKYGGGFEKLAYSPYTSTNQLPPLNDDPSAALGAKVYAASCAPCHQASGLGMAGQFPPLAGSEWVVTPGPGRAIRVILNGAAGPMQVKGAQYNNVMVPWRDNLSDEEIAAVATYIRNQWGNKASSVTPEQVKAIRDATADRSAPWTAEELLKVPETE